MGSVKVRRVINDFHRLLKSVASFSDNQALVFFDDSINEEGDGFRFEVAIEPKAGPYAGGRYWFQIWVESEELWPINPPIVRCLTDVYHPNIDITEKCPDITNVCINVLEQWQPSYDFENCVQALLFLFYEPNFDDILSVLCLDDDNLEEKIGLTMKGGYVEGYYYKPNPAWVDKLSDFNSNELIVTNLSSNLVRDIFNMNDT